MTPDVGGPVWSWGVGLMIVILGIALVYALIMWSRRVKSPEARQVRDNATERVYRQAEQQDRRELPS
jgi:hypothetical protein